MPKNNKLYDIITALKPYNIKIPDNGESILQRIDRLNQAKEVFDSYYPQRFQNLTDRLQKIEFKQKYQRWQSASVYYLIQNNADCFYPYIDLSAVTIEFYFINELPAINKWISEWSSKLLATKNGFSRENYHHIIKHFNHFFDSVNQLKYEYIQAMLERLKAMTTSGFVHANPLVTAIEKFEKGKASESVYDSELIMPSLKPLTEQQFLLFEKTIEKYGTQDQVKSLNNLPWRNNLNYQMSSSPLSWRGKKPHIFFIPKTLDKYIPKRRLWPNWFFRRHNYKYDYFQKKRYILTQFQALPSLKFLQKSDSMTAVKAKQYIAQFNYVIKVIKQQHLKLRSNKIRYWFPWLRAKTIEDVWQQELTRLQEVIVKLRAIITEKTSEQVIKSVLEPHLAADWTTFNYTKSLQKNLSLTTKERQGKHINTMKKTNPEKLIHAALDKKSSPQKNYHDGHFILLLRQLADNQAIDAGEVRFIQAYLTNTQIAYPDFLKKLSLKEKNSLNNCMQQYYKLLKNGLNILPSATYLKQWAFKVRALHMIDNEFNKRGIEKSSYLLKVAVKNLCQHLLDGKVNKLQKFALRNVIRHLISMTNNLKVGNHLLADKLSTLSKHFMQSNHKKVKVVAEQIKYILTLQLLRFDAAECIKNTGFFLDKNWKSTTIKSENLPTIRSAAITLGQKNILPSNSIIKLIDNETKTQPMFVAYFELQVSLSQLQVLFEQQDMQSQPEVLQHQINSINDQIQLIKSDSSNLLGAKSNILSPNYLLQTNSFTKKENAEQSDGVSMLYQSDSYQEQSKLSSWRV